jgi:glycosyltransferase involved in cell wall biosynthesis
MRICHVSPHLPPDQAANALLPAQLGQWMRARGDEVSYVAHEAGQTTARAADLAGPVAWVPRRPAGGGLRRWLRLDALELRRQVNAALDQRAPRADLLHLHSNGLIVETAAAWAMRRGKPYVLTLYGTEIWHYRRRRPFDPFTQAYRGAAQVTFYSHGLLGRAREVGLDRPGMSVTYPAVSDAFTPHDEAARRALRQEAGITERFVFLNVKRLHELAGQTFLIQAFAQVARERPDVRLVICGTGALRQQLDELILTLGLEHRVTMTGLVSNDQVARYMALSDVFVLPSRLEALPTVAVEALASGTPVISADHPGGIELGAIFSDDIKVVPRETVEPLARAMEEFLARPHRTCPHTTAEVTARFRPEAVLAGFDAVYRQAWRPRT